MTKRICQRTSTYNNFCIGTHLGRVIPHEASDSSPAFTEINVDSLADAPVSYQTLTIDWPNNEPNSQAGFHIKPHHPWQEMNCDNAINQSSINQELKHYKPKDSIIDQGSKQWFNRAEFAQRAMVQFASENQLTYSCPYPNSSSDEIISTTLHQCQNTLDQLILPDPKLVIKAACTAIAGGHAFKPKDDNFENTDIFIPW